MKKNKKLLKLYHYVNKSNDVLEKGLLSFSSNPKADLQYYFKRTNGKTAHQEICEWLEACFQGRSRAIRAFSEPIQWTERSIHCLKEFVDSCDMFEINLSLLQNDGLIEAVYVSPSVLDFPKFLEQELSDELFFKLPNSISDIDYTPVNWGVCDDKLKRRFAFVRYYLIVVKGGIIPPKYLTLITRTENIE